MKSLIDIHVHLAAFPNEKNGCYMSPRFRGGMLVKLVKWKLGLKGETADSINWSYIERLRRDLTESRFVGKAVILALDGVYDESGRLDENKTHMLIGNDYVKHLVDQYQEEFLFGASVNPQRRDALDELSRVIEGGAKLIKVLPPSQVFNPMDDRYRPYYKFLADKKIPLLCHIGYEFSVTAGKQEYGFPEGLRLALDEGVNVIGAHACSSAIFFQGRFYRAYLDLMKRYPNFYVDLSAVTLPNRASVVYCLRRHPEYFDRFLFGTDYPLSAYATPFLGSLTPKKQWELWRTKNIFDKQAMVLEEMGIQFDSKTTERLLGIK
jgi:predicted TIM-barrel fold metal-dependent hydrolase